MELERDLASIRAQGLGVAAISYDSAAVLKNFGERQHIMYPLLSDSGSQVIRSFGILNETVKAGTEFYGIPYPGTFILDVQGTWYQSTSKTITVSVSPLRTFWCRTSDSRRMPHAALRRPNIFASSPRRAHKWRSLATGSCSASKLT